MGHDVGLHLGHRPVQRLGIKDVTLDQVAIADELAISLTELSNVTTSARSPECFAAVAPGIAGAAGH
jgi:hypothetical protein